MRLARVAFWLLLLSIAALRPVVAQQYVISTVAGGGPPSMPASGVAGPIGTPQRVATDAAGTVYFTSFNSVFKLDQSGILTRVAGISKLGYSGDGGPAVSARLQVGVGGADLARPGGLVVDSAGLRGSRYFQRSSGHSYAGAYTLTKPCQQNALAARMALCATA